jgi:hypothetical protein
MTERLQKEDIVQRLLAADLRVERLSEIVRQRRQKLYELALQNPMKVVAYFERTPLSADPREQRLRSILLRIAAECILDGQVTFTR